MQPRQVLKVPLVALALSLACAATVPTASANSVLKQSVKMRAVGMKQWRDGDFLGAFGSCYGAKQLLAGIKGLSAESLAEAVGYTDLCIGLALQQMKVKGGTHDFCRSFKASQKNFAIVDAARKSRGEKLVDGGYMADQLRDSRCK